MPTLLRIGHLRVVIYPNDHRPEHVHVVGRGSEAVFFLNCGAGAVSLRENEGFKLRQLRRIARALNPHVTKLCDAWRDIHANQ